MASQHLIPAGHVHADQVLPLFCFSELAKLLGKEVPHFELPEEFAKMECPLFVTWKVREGERLRGCIGTFGHVKLPHGLAEYTGTSALRDRRFNPVEAHELPLLQCGVSLLVDFEHGKDYLDWEIGIHGIRIHLTVAGRSYSATYLPEVPGEQGWSKIDAINSLVRKAGYKGRVDVSVYRVITLQRYKSRRFHATHDDWAARIKAAAAS